MSAIYCSRRNVTLTDDWINNIEREVAKSTDGVVTGVDNEAIEARENYHVYYICTVYVKYTHGVEKRTFEVAAWFVNPSG